MKFLSTFIFLFTLHFHADSQIQQPVKWEFTAKKLNTLTYQINLKAKLQPTWHIYSQSQPKDAIAIPLQVSFAKNSLVELDGKPAEIGKLTKVYDKTIKVGAWHYSNNLDVVQLVKLKKPVKTTVKGMVTFQVCTDKMCLTAEEKEFVVALN